MKKINLLLSGALTLALLSPTSAFSAQTTGKVKSLPQTQQTKILQSLLNTKLQDMTENINFNMTTKVDAKYAKLIEAPSSLNFKAGMKYDVDKDVCDANFNLGLKMNIPSSKLYNAYFNGSAWTEIQNLKDLGNLNVLFKLTQLNIPNGALATTDAQQMASMLPLFKNKLFKISMKDLLNMDPNMKKEMQPTFDAYKKIMSNLGTMDTTGLQKTYKPLLDTATYTINGNKMSINFVISDFNKFTNDLVSGLNLQQILGGTSLAQGLDLKSLTDQLKSAGIGGDSASTQVNIKNVKYSVELTNNVMTGVKASFVVADTEAVKNGTATVNVPVQYQADIACTISHNSVTINPTNPGAATDIMNIASMLK